MREINFSADELVAALLALSESAQVCLLDSCGVAYSGSHLLIAGLNPIETSEITEKSAAKTLEIFNAQTKNDNLAYIFTLSYDFGLKLQKINLRPKEFLTAAEPDIFLAAFDCLIVHDYDLQRSFLIGNENRFDEITENLSNAAVKNYENATNEKSSITSNFTRREYIAAIEKIKDAIRCGDTYQTNLTQQIRARLPENLDAPTIFYRLRKNHPAPFAAFIKRAADYVVSVSPERFFKTENGKWKTKNSNQKHSRLIKTAPIKGTRPRGKTAMEDTGLKNELLNSAKDRAENVMIVDLVRNDIGRICEFGTVAVEKLCDLETHPTLFHLVSTVTGNLRENLNLDEIIKAVFPCGSITGAPKIRTMQIIDQIETANRGLSMGAIGIISPAEVQSSMFKVQSSKSEEKSYFGLWTLDFGLDSSVAIRTMVIKNNQAIFNVGGGIVIDSEPEAEYEETMTKAQALLASINAEWKS